MRFIDGIDLEKNEAKNLRLQNLPADIGTPVDGLIYYKNASGIGIRAYINGAWQTLATMADVTAGGISSTLVDAKGDLIAATGPDAVAREAVGANGTFYVADSAQATGHAWRTLVDGDIPSTIARDTEVATAVTNSEAGQVRDGDAAGGDLAGTYPNPTIAAGAIVNADVNAAAAIARSKLDFGTGLVNADIAAAAAIAYAKLNLAGSIVNGDIGAAAAIAYSKLNLAGSIVNADVAAGAAIAGTKIAFTPAQNIAATNVQAAIEEVVTDLTTQITAVSEGKSWKDPVRAASTGNLALTGTQTIDGIAVVAGERVLAKNQTAPAENGIYVVAAGAWARAADMNAADEADNATVLIEAGTVNAGDVYTQTADIVTIGTTAMVWVKSSEGNTTYTADETTLTLTGSSFSVKAGGIANAQVAAGAAIARSKLDFGAGLVNGDIAAAAAIAYSKLSLANSVVNADIAAAAAIAYSKLNLAGAIVNGDIAGAAAIAYSKLNLAGSITAADVNGTPAASGGGTVRVSRTFEDTIAGGATSEVITHGLNTRAVHVSLINPATPWDEVLCTTERTSVNTVTLRSSVNLPAGYIVVITG